MKARIRWNGQGGELDSTVVEHADDDGKLTKALIEMVERSIVSVGDTFVVEEVE